MKLEEHQDRLVDLLLRELVGNETPPDVRGPVLEAAGGLSHAPKPRRMPTRPLVALPTPRRLKAPAFAIAATLTLLGVAGTLIHVQRLKIARTPMLTAISGTVTPSAGLIRPGESLATGPGSSAVLTYQDGTVVEISPETRIVMTDRSPWDRSKGIELLAGKLQAEVAHQIPGSPMVLNSKHAAAEVVGTKLSFDLNDDRAHLEVTDGKVRFVPHKAGKIVLVESGYFAESGNSGFRHEKIPALGITRFTLMNAETDQPMREQALVNGEMIILSSLPTRQINIRADFEGDPPDSVKISLKRQRGHPTGLEALPSDDHRHPPYFVAGDHWADGRPEDCAAWTPPAGLYHLSAEAIYADAAKQALSTPLTIKFRISE